MMPISEPKALEPFCPIRNVTEKYPPTMLIHGTIDTDVPHEQSVQMDRELARHGVPHEFISVPGGGHGLGGMDRARLAEIRERVVAFLSRAPRVTKSLETPPGQVTVACPLSTMSSSILHLGFGPAYVHRWDHDCSAT